MTVLGRGGVLKLRRDLPDPVPVQAALDSVDGTTFSIVVTDPRLWTGDQVTLLAPRGLPFNINTMGIPNGGALPMPDCPDGYNFYEGGGWLPSTTRTHVTGNTAKFYRPATSNSAFIYIRNGDVGLTTTATYYIYRDQLDRISFYTTRSAALRGATADRVPLFKVDFGVLTATVLSSSSAWKLQAEIQEWRLNLTAEEVDTTAIGERFGDAIKDVITGGGSLDFFIDRFTSETQHDATFLLNLLLMLDKGCEAQAEFYIFDRQLNSTAPQFLPGALYYDVTLLPTSQALNLRPDEIIAGSLNFVTVREIALRMGES